MDIEILGLLGSVYAAASLAAIAFERRTDVLRTSYVGFEDRTAEQRCHPARRLWAPSAIDRFRWKARNLIYLTSIVAC